MSDNTVNVNVTANTAELQSGMQQAPSLVQRAAEQMRGHFTKLRADTTSQTQQAADSAKAAFGSMAQMTSTLQAAALQGGGAWGNLASQMRASGGVIGGAVGGVMHAALALGAVLSVGMFAKMVLGAADAAGKLHDVAQQSGISVGALSGLASIGKTSGTSLDAIASAATRLSVNLSKGGEESAGAASALRALGIDFATFQAMSPDQRMLTAAQAMDKFADGSGKTAAAVALFGKQGAELLPFLGDLADAGEVNAKVSAEQAAAADTLGDNLTKLSGQGGAWKRTLSMAMIPALADASSAFLDVFKQTGGLQDQIKKLAADGSIDRWTRGAVNGLSYVVDIAVVLKRAFVSLAETFAAAAAQVTIGLGGIAEAFGKLMRGDFTGAKETLASSMRDVVSVGKQWWADQVDEWSSQTLGSKLRAAFEKAAGTSTALKTGRTQLEYTNKGLKGDKTEKDPSQMAAFEAQLEAEKVVASERDALHGMSKQAEAAFWADILNLSTLNEKDRLHVSKKASAARVAFLQEEAQHADQIGQAQLAAWEQRNLAQVDQDAESARNRVALGFGTQADLLAQEQEFENRRYEIKMAAAQANLAALDPARDPVQVAQLNTQIEALEQAHQMRLAQIRGQIAVESAAEMNAIWTDLSGRMSSLWDSGINAMMNGTLTWRNAMRAVGAEMVGWFAGIVKRQVTTWIFGEQAKSGATAAGTAQRWLMESWAAAKSVALWAATAVKNIMTSAWEAMAAAWKAVVGIPYVGPALAVAAAGATFAGVSAIAGRVASAEGGYDIPAGVNPMTQLHEKEMVLPAKQADVIRDLADSGGGGAAQAVHININALDGQSVKRVLIQNSDALAAAMRAAKRDFQL